ncbi:bifunctional protein-disulfide isomerase/oxidoreductase DsbC [Pseudocolwellia sp. AS88]|uniref:bifunctional protein-disulfide isomerase/oxidoreductase DsbC n=1 Tax=Pseudocolwellia sp. AS88 TaxID=3063958 RepID=UPI0026F346E1|nr:bifunctional protein-disulfide isomerase/oxidoreductase DsbC [Pseudocolwellia sp. AS88]MDO7086823.1 bifunctional protein-disulfide isomerase/oxidoreductase DsbC [Pseudocolwellia sp. AS88]
MKIFKSVLVLVSVLLVNTSAMAVSADTQSKSEQNKGQTALDTKVVAAKLLSKLGLQAESIKASSMEGMAEAVTKQGLFYVSYDGNYILQGKLYSIKEDVIDLTENSLADVRLNGVKKFDNNMISYPAKNEKHVITVFTDITCGYCRKLHEQMQDYNDLGITVRYLAYPRAGVRDELGNYSQSFKDLRSIWCHESPDVALTKAKMGSQVAQRICEQPIEAEFNFGRQIGVNGTPAIILENGMMMPGYQPPERLAQILNSL